MLTLLRKIFLRLAFIVERYQNRNKLQQGDPNFAIQARRVKKWYDDPGHEQRRFTYALDGNSVVFDLGGYKGEFAKDIYCRYGCRVFIFEPVKKFYEHIKTEFSNNKNINVFQFGLGPGDFLTEISLDENASSIFTHGDGRQEKISIKSFNNFIEEQGISRIDLMKVNIEGGEYDLIESILAAGNAGKIVNLQVQFHDFIIENAANRMHAIYKQLEQTHELTWHYEFVWDNWKLKSTL